MNLTTSRGASVLGETDLMPDGTAGALHRHPPSLPDEPLVVLEPRESWAAMRPRELWTYRELLYFLAWRDVKVRYKQTVFGVAWAILQPIFMMLIFTLFFGKLAHISSDSIPYAIFAFAGLLPWTFFSTAAVASGNSLVNSAGMITKVYFPRVLVPAASVAATFVDFLIGFGVLAVLMIYYRVAPTWEMALLPLFVVLLVLLTLGFGMLMSALNVKYRDIRFALPFFVQIWFFASPIIYPVSLVTEGAKHAALWHALLALNPMTGIIEGFRACLFGEKSFDWVAISVSAAVTLVLFVYATFKFRRLEKNFADIV